MITVTDLTFRYRESAEPTIRDINLHIAPGTFLGITGPAGSGKSTLTYLLNGIAPHCYPGDLYGSVVVDGMDTCDVSLTDISAVVGSVCQDIDSQMVTSIVEDEVLYGPENFGMPKDRMEACVTRALEEMGIQNLRNRAIAGLSGGQKQKVAIASVIACSPKVLVLDEPTAELDPAGSVAVFDLLRNYARTHGTTVIVVEQKIALLAEFADYIVVLDKGRIAVEGSPQEVLARADELLEIGVACPRATSLSRALAGAGVYAGSVCRTAEEAAQMVCEVCR